MKTKSKIFNYHSPAYILYSEILGGAEIYTVNKFILAGEGVLYTNKLLYNLLRAWIGDSSNIKCINDSAQSMLSFLFIVFRSSKVVFANLGATRFLPLFPLKEKHLYIHEDPNGLSKITLIRIKLASHFASNIFVPSIYAQKLLKKYININSSIDYYKKSSNRTLMKPDIGKILVLGVVGRISKDKNTLNTVYLAIEINKKLKVKIEFAGEVHDRDIWEIIIRLLHNAKIEYGLKMYGREEMKNYYHSVNVILHTSKIENMPLVMYEAFEHSVPIFMSDAGGISELLDSTFVIPDNVSIAAHKIVNWIESV